MNYSFSWLFHNVIGHSIAGILWFFGLTVAGNWIHEVTLPVEEKAENFKDRIEAQWRNLLRVYSDYNDREFVNDHINDLYFYLRKWDREFKGRGFEEPEITVKRLLSWEAEMERQEKITRDWSTV